MLIILVIISRLVFLVIALSVSFFVQKNSLKRLPLFLFFFPVSSVITLYTLWASALENIPSERINILIIISSICVVISILLTYIFYGKTSAELNRLYEIQNQNDRIASDEAYYKILDMQNKQLKSIIHDEKNHLSAIKSLAENPEVSEYIDELYDNIIENSLFGNTNNKILDLIINKYQYICNAEGIDFYVSIKTSNLSDIEKTDLISLLGNLLDNAVDAAKLSERKKTICP